MYAQFRSSYPSGLSTFVFMIWASKDRRRATDAEKAWMWWNRKNLLKKGLIKQNGYDHAVYAVQFVQGKWIDTEQVITFEAVYMFFHL